MHFGQQVLSSTSVIASAVSVFLPTLSLKVYVPGGSELCPMDEARKRWK